jgi:hypothetical protein
MGFEEFFLQMKDLAAAMMPLIPILIGLVEFYKLCGLPSDKPAIIACVVTGVVLALAIHASILYPAVGIWFLVALAGLLTGMTATGLYSVGNRWAGKIGNGWASKMVQK